MCLTRNDDCVHERHGRFEDVQVTGPHGLVLGPDIDLRLFLGQWTLGFAVREPLKGGERAQPAVLRRLRRRRAQDLRHRRDRPRRLRRADRASHARPQPPALASAPRAADPVDRPDSEIDVEGLRTAWRDMRDTHEFFGMLGKFKVGRVQALRLVGEEFARELPPRALRARAGSGGRRRDADHDLRRQPRLHPDPHRADRAPGRARTAGSTCSIPTSTCICATRAWPASSRCASRPRTASSPRSRRSTSRPQHPADVRRAQARQARARAVAQRSWRASRSRRRRDATAA